MYAYRPSRTSIAKNPELQPEYMFEAGPTGPKVHDGDKKRSTLLKSPSSSDSSDGEDSEDAEKL